MSAKIAVIGSGISGIAAANSLLAKNHAVTIFDQGKNPGGRLGLRTLRNHPFTNRVVDVGAAYFTVSHDLFKNKVDEWSDLGLVNPWTNTFHVFDSYEITTISDPMRFAAKKGLRSLAIYELEKLKNMGVEIIQEKKIEKVFEKDNKVIVDNEVFDAVVLAMPGKQAARILQDQQIKNELEKQVWQSALSAWLVIDGELPNYDAMFVNNHEVISLIINDGKRRSDNAPVINAITTHDYAKSKLEDFQNYLDEIVDHVLELWRIDAQVLEKGITRWSIAQPLPAQRPFLGKSIAIVGDAYDLNPRIESAWVDGVAVLNQLEAIQ